MEDFGYYPATSFAYVPEMASDVPVHHPGAVYYCPIPCCQGMGRGAPAQLQPVLAVHPGVNMGYPGGDFGMWQQLPPYNPIQYIAYPYQDDGILMTVPQFQVRYPPTQPIGGMADGMVVPAASLEEQFGSDASAQLVPTGDGGDWDTERLRAPPLDTLGVVLEPLEQKEGADGGDWAVTQSLLDPRGCFHKSRPITKNGVRVSLKTRNPKRRNYCSFCRSNKETMKYCRTHLVKDRDGNVTCPVLQAVVCPICGQTGKAAHTIRYCPDNGFDKSIGPGGYTQFQYSRNAAGDKQLLKF